MSEVGQKRRLGSRPITSGLSRPADILRVSRHVSKVPSRNLHRLTCGTHSPLFVSVNMELIPSGGDYDPSFRGTARPRGGEIGADDLRVDVDLGASEAEEVPLSHVSARAVEAVRLLLMINSLNLETLMKVIPKRRFVGVDDRALRNPSADE
jgi:hypothetical protein